MSKPLPLIGTITNETDYSTDLSTLIQYNCIKHKQCSDYEHDRRWKVTLF